MIDLSTFSEFSTCNYADFLSPASFMDRGIRSLWSGGPRLVGRAFTVRCEPGDNLMMHAAIYEAPRGSVVVLDAGDDKFAVAGGNVCAVAKQRGIAGFIIDGVIRDIAEIREMKFPVYARGIVPKPGKKAKLGELGGLVICGGIPVRTGDVVIADEDGVVIVEYDKAASVFEQTRKKSRAGAKSVTRGMATQPLSKDQWLDFWAFELAALYLCVGMKSKRSQSSVVAVMNFMSLPSSTAQVRRPEA